MNTTKQNKPCTCDANDDSVQSCERHSETIKHTPGPWAIHSNIGKRGSIGVVANGAPCIVAIMGNDKEWPAEAHANARLIAAAPELLEACQAADNWLLPYPEDPKNPHTNSLRALMDQIRSAITKATGATL